MKIIEESKSEIPVLDMQDGHIGIITAWKWSTHVGDVVQRWGEHLICLGKGYTSSWPHFFNETSVGFGNRVRILPPGSKLEI